MRISDWSSDVCSSDLLLDDQVRGGKAALNVLRRHARREARLRQRLRGRLLKEALWDEPLRLLPDLPQPAVLAASSRLLKNDLVRPARGNALCLLRRLAGAREPRRSEARLGGKVCVRKCHTRWSTVH